MRLNDGLTENAKALVDEAMATGIGRRVWAAAQIEADLEAGVTITLDEIQADEHCLMRVLRSERHRQMEDDRQEAERKRRQ